MTLLLEPLAYLALLLKACAEVFWITRTMIIKVEVRRITTVITTIIIILSNKIKKYH